MSVRHVLAALLALTVTVGVVSDVDAAPAKKKGKQQKLYKWVDKDGVTHFGNAIPPEYASQGGEQIDKTGQTVRTIEAEKNEEQLAELERQRAVEAEAKAAEAEQAKRDRMLLGTYPSLKDLKRARDAAVAAHEAQAKLASGTVSNLERELVRLSKQEQTAAKGGKPVPEKLAADKARVEQELLANQRFVLDKQAEIKEVDEQYEKDRKRLIELHGDDR